MIMPHFTSDATKDDFDYLRERSGMSLNCLDRLYSLGMACADAQRKLDAYKQVVEELWEPDGAWSESIERDTFNERIAARLAANA